MWGGGVVGSAPGVRRRPAGRPARTWTAPPRVGRCAPAVPGAPCQGAPSCAAPPAVRRWPGFPWWTSAPPATGGRLARPRPVRNLAVADSVLPGTASLERCSVPAAYRPRPRVVPPCQHPRYRHPRDWMFEGISVARQTVGPSPRRNSGAYAMNPATGITTGDWPVADVVGSLCSARKAGAGAAELLHPAPGLDPSNPSRGLDAPRPAGGFPTNRHDCCRPPGPGRQVEVSAPKNRAVHLLCASPPSIPLHRPDVRGSNTRVGAPCPGAGGGEPPSTTGPERAAHPCSARLRAAASLRRRAGDFSLPFIGTPRAAMPTA
jgi:hypothetical protein